jgi:hypothetical protein
MTPGCTAGTASPCLLDGVRWRLGQPEARRSPFRRAIENTHRVMIPNHDRGGLWLTEFGFACPARGTCLSDSGPLPTWPGATSRRPLPPHQGPHRFLDARPPNPQDRNPAWDLPPAASFAEISPKPAFRRVKARCRLRWDPPFRRLQELDVQAAPSSGRKPPGGERRRSDLASS